MKRNLAILVCFFMISPAFAALLTTEGDGGFVEKVKLPASASLSVDGETVKLTAVGSGLRVKKVVFVNVQVYAGQLFVSNLGTFKKSEAEALGAVKEQKAVAIQMHFLRDVDAENVQKSFKDALKINGINTEDTSIKEFLEAVTKGGEAKKGKALTVAGHKTKDGETLSYENTEGQIVHIKGPSGLVEKIFSIWLGKPADDGVAQLKKSILK